MYIPIYAYTHTYKLIWALAQWAKTFSGTLQDGFLSMTSFTGKSSLTCLLFQGSFHISQSADTSFSFFCRSSLN